MEGLPPGFTALNRQRVAQGVQGYQRAATETASPAQLIVMLYQGCIRFTAIGKTALEQQDYTTSRENLLKAQAIIAELMGSLNMSFGDLANNLMRLYDYMYRRLIDANIRRDAAAADAISQPSNDGGSRGDGQGADSDRQADAERTGIEHLHEQG